jgi:LacI family transcriptional regulator
MIPPVTLPVSLPKQRVNRKLMTTKTRTATINDVAREAGVSVSTVSRVLNAKVDVAEETQKRIESAIESLGYTSSLAARSMRSRKNFLIGLIMPDIEYPFAVEVMKGVNRAIARSDFDLLVYTTGNVQKSVAASHEQHFIALLNNSITDGVIIVAPAANSFESNSPIVSIDPHQIHPNFPSVHANNYQGALDAMDYLLRLGHRRIGFIAGRPELESGKRRLSGYRDALANAGIPIDENLIMPGDFTEKTGIEATTKLLNLPDPPTAIFACNDQTAMGVYIAAENLGMKIPEDLSVIGFDNIPEAKFMRLTTVDQFLAKMGYLATEMCIKLINKEVLESDILKIPTELVVRESCRAI